MKKLHIFVETDDVRFPNNNDWLMNNDGDMLYQPNGLKVESNLYVHHAIELHTEINSVEVTQYHDKDILQIWNLSIEGGQKKTKKWRWLYENEKGKIELTEGHYATREECEQVMNPTGKKERVAIRKVEETEI